MLRTLPYLMFAAVFIACQANEEPQAEAVPTEQSIAEALIGTWETVEIEVDYVSYEGGDTLAHELIKEADWSKIYGAKPPQTTFTADGKSKRTHRFKDGRVSDVVNGLWKVQSADTLLFIEPNKTLYFAYNLNGERLELTGLTDSDFDGAVDDKRRTVMRLVGRTE
ncbi:MAG: hypothetical protein AAF597_06735 [Bacteroidota bacterium]